MNRTFRIPRGIFIVALIVGSIVGLWFFGLADRQDRDAAQESEAKAQEQKTQVEEVAAPLAEQVLKVCAAGGPAAAELVANGVCPAARETAEVIGATGPAGPAGPQGIPGPAPTATQVLRAVESFCVANAEACRGPAGSDGRSVSASQVAAAVASYCDLDGQCRGPQGPQGEQGEAVNGENGVDGAPGAPGAQGVQGPQGPPPTAGQIATAVTEYCGANGGCRGPAGPVGPAGPAGPAGNSGTVVTDFTCEATAEGVRLSLRFSDAPARDIVLTFSNNLLGTISC